jgi:hypothetical protein
MPSRNSTKEVPSYRVVKSTWLGIGANLRTGNRDKAIAHAQMLVSHLVSLGLLPRVTYEQVPKEDN